MELDGIAQTITKSGDTAMTKEEYERAEPKLEPVVERDPEVDELIRKAKLRAVIQTIYSHRAEFEGRVRNNLREYGVDADSEWMILLDELRAEVIADEN